MAKEKSNSGELENVRPPSPSISNNGGSPPITYAEGSTHDDELNLDGLRLPRDLGAGTHAVGSAHDDEFDLDSLRLPQDFGASTGVKKILTSVPIRRPNPQEFIRVHPDPRWWLQTLVLEVKAYRDTYLIHPSIRDELLARREVVPKVLFSTVTRQGVLFLWAIRMPDQDGRLDTWSQSALEATQPAKTHWVRVVPNHDLRGYEVYQAANLSDDPTWPATSFDEVVKIACKNRFIDSWDHPILRQLRGEI